MLNSFQDQPKFGPISDDPSQLDENRRIEREGFMIILLVRLYIFERFLKSRPKDISIAVWMLQWAVFQFAPLLSCKGSPDLSQDIFQHSTEQIRLANISPFAVQALLRKTWERIQSDHPEFVKTFYLVIDEAQVGANTYSTSHFRSRQDPTVPRSALTEMRETFGAFRIWTGSVISGVSISEDQIVGSVESTTARLDSNMVVVGVEGGFYDKDEHRRYIEKHLDTWHRKRRIPVKSYRRLVARMLDKLRGR